MQQSKSENKNYKKLMGSSIDNSLQIKDAAEVFDIPYLLLYAVNELNVVGEGTWI